MIASLVFALVATIGVAVPVAIYVAMGARAARILRGLEAWMVHNNAVIMAVLLLILGTKILGDGIATL